MTHLECREEQQTLIWRLSRPERGNGLGTTLARELAQALAALRARPTLPRVLVITATPVVKGAQRTWIAGGDLKELATLTSRDDARDYAATLSRFLLELDRLPLPVLVAIDGEAIGGGAELALAGDWRLATRGSRLTFKQLKVGLATGYGGARRLVELVGLSVAQGLLLGCRSLDADEACRLGIIHEVVEDEASLWAAVARRCEELTSLEPRALAAQKAMLWHAVRSHPGAAREAEVAEFEALWRNPSHERFLEAFLARSTAPKGRP